MTSTVINPGCAPESPFLVPGIVIVMARQRIARLDEFIAARTREARTRKVLGEPEPPDWSEQNSALAADRKRLVEMLKSIHAKQETKP